MTRIKFTIPPEIKQKYIGKCKCGGFVFRIGGKNICGRCSYIDAHQEAEKKQNEYIKTHDGNLESYNQEKADKKKARQEKKDFKQQQYKD